MDGIRGVSSPIDLFQVRLPGTRREFDGLVGAAFGSFLSWVLSEGVRRRAAREGMGMGDWKMMAMVGAFLGCGEFLTLKKKII